MPNPTLLSARLILRPIHISDAPLVFEYRSDAAANRFQGFIPKQLAEVEDFIQNKVATEINLPGTWFQFVIIKKESNTIIGDIGLHFKADKPVEIEFGCTLKASEQRQGFAHEALGEIANYAFTVLQKKKVTASVDPRNTASIKMVERLNFIKEAHFEKTLYLNGEWVDDAIYSLVKPK